MINQFTHWLAMGGYSGYIWPAYGLVLIVLATHRLGIRCHSRNTRKKLQQWFKDSNL